MVTATGTNASVSVDGALENLPVPTYSDADFTWTLFRPAKRPAILIPVLAAMIAVTVAGAVIFHNILPGLIASALLLGFVKDYALPIRYTLSSKSATVRCLGAVISEIEWDKVESVYRVDGGLKLSPLKNPGGSRLESARGVTLLVKQKKRDFIEHYVQVLSSQPIQTLTGKTIL